MQPIPLKSTRTLNFKPIRQPSRVFPPIFAEELQLSGWGSSLPCIESKQSLAETLLEIYPELTLPELARLYEQLTFQNIQGQEVMLKYGIRDLEFCKPIFDYVLSLPMDVQNILSEKHFSLGDIRSILPSSQLSSRHYEEARNFLLTCLSLRMSKSQVVEACELANELLEMGNFVLPSEIDKDKLIVHLKEKRFPNSTAQDRFRSQRLKAEKWPHKSQVRWMRQGDLSGIELKVFTTSPQELNKFVKELNSVPQENIEKIWNAD